MTTINYNLFFATSAFVSGLVLIPLLLSNHIRQIGINRIGLYTLGFLSPLWLCVCMPGGLITTQQSTPIHPLGIIY